MAAPVLASSNTGTGASAVVTKPSGTVNGDLLVAYAVGTNARTNITAPAGWTNSYSLTVVAGSVEGAIYTKTAASEGASWTWTWAGSPTDTLVYVLRITGWSSFGTSLIAFGAWNGVTASAVGAISDPETLNLLLGVGYKSTGAPAATYWQQQTGIGTLLGGSSPTSTNSRLTMSLMSAQFYIECAAAAPITTTRAGSGSNEMVVSLNVNSGGHQSRSEFM